MGKIIVNLASVTLLLFAFFTNAQEPERIFIPDTSKKVSGKTVDDFKPIKNEPRLSNSTSRSGDLSALSSFTNLQVNNNNGALTGARFTQTTSSIVAFGNNVVVSYADAGSNTFVNNKFTGFAYSTDGGATFTDGGELPTTVVGDGGLSVLARNNTTGRIYLLTTSFSTGRALVFRSDNNGVNWLSPVAGTPGTISDSRPWITVDNFAGSGNGNVYLISKRFGSGGFPLGVFFYRSIDHGATFGPGGGIPITPVAHNGSFVTVGPDHSVYAFWSENNLIRMRKSTNQGVSFGTAVTVASGIVGFDLGLTGVRQGTITSAPFRANTYPQAVINPVSGHIYLTYANVGTAPDKADIFFVMSTDGGATWSSPARVNDDLTNTDQWVPTIAVTPDGLNLGIFYNSRQDDPANNNLFRYYSRVATISGSTVTFTPSTLVSLVPSLPEFGRDPVVNTLFMVDYTQAVATSDGFFVTWTDNRDDYTPGLPRKDPNIYFARFPATGPPPTPYLLSGNASITSGDGIIDAGECNQINLSVSNIGSGDATGISAVLASSTPGITVSQNSSAYPDIAKNTTGTNTTPFTICTGEGFECGSSILLTLTLTYEGGSVVLNFSLPTGALSSPLAFHNNTSTPLADLATTNIPITVSGINGNIGKVILSLHVTHTFVGDLDISLISPDGTIVELSTNNGSSGDNYGSSCSSRTIFDDDASVFIYSVAAPFAGTFKPEGLLSSFAGKSGSSVNGPWILRIVDEVGQDVGNFNCATLTITPVECAGSLSVTINQAAGQADPTSTSPINFTAIFSEAVTGFTSSDVTLGGTAGATTVEITEVAPNNGTTYNIAVSGMTSNGTVIATIPANVALSSGNVANTASSSTDNTVTYVASSNTCPVANTQSVTVSEGNSVNFQLQAVDADEDPLQYSVTQAPLHGTVVLQTQTGAASYTPTAGYCGPDEFRFRVYDGECYSGEATVTIVMNCNECPVASPLNITVEKNNAINFQLPAADADGDALQFSIVTAPSHGQVVLNAQTGTATYTPTTGYTGPDQFTYKVSDGKCEDEATVSITIITCPDGKGYWKNNPDSWPEGSTPMLLGTQSYTKTELLEILNMPVGIGQKADASIMLAHQLIVAKLNVLNGAVTPDPVADSIVAADILIGNNRIPMRVRPNTPLGQRMVANAAFLESYNSGLLTEACNPVTEPLTSGKKQISLQEISQTIKAFEVKVYPNPSGSYFNIMINSNDAKVRVVLQVFDQYGRLIEAKNSVSNGSTVRLGDLYRPGVYYVRVIQSKQHKEMKLIKLSD